LNKLGAHATRQKPITARLFPKTYEQRRTELLGGDYDGMAAVERLCLDDIV
jgi:hypothetical protein